MPLPVSGSSPGGDADVPRLRIVGAGRAGRALGTALVGAGWRCQGYLGRGDDIGSAATDVDLLVIATPDDVIATVAAAVRPVATTVIAHLAGSLGPDVIAPHPQRVALHPLVCLPRGPQRPSLDPAPIRGAWWAVTAAGGERARALARRVVDDLDGRVLAVDDAQRTGYHAAATMAANHLVALLAAVERVAAPAGVPLAAYLDLVRQTVEQVAATGPAAALTGPVARGDWATVHRHLDVLDPADIPAYVALSREAARVAGRGWPDGLGQASGA